MQPRPIANPPNPWATTETAYLEGSAPDARLVVYEDGSRSILSRNDSPDIPFTYSVNPYRGCFHGCAYCYARPSHEFLSFGAGTDFERKIVVKKDAADLLREAFDRPSWEGELVVFSGVTDCYQPLEASYRLTRQCLEVCREYRNPVGVITKAPLIERDVDLLVELSAVASCAVSVSIPFWDRDAARAMEPFVATPERRMRTVERLAKAGLAVQVNIAPVVPGLGDEDAPAIIAAARDAGAKGIGWIMLRLPGPVAEVFEARVREALPLRADKILRRVQEMRGGRLNDPRFGARMRGEGVYAESVRALIEGAVRRAGLTLSLATIPSAQTFTRPDRGRRQLSLF